MRLWRLSSERRARDFDGGYGLSNDGRWNTRGRPVTYCCTAASLTALEKRVHVTDAALLPPQVLVTYEMPDNISSRTITLANLPEDWKERQTHTQAIGNRWLASRSEALLFVPSAIMPVAGIPDRNVLVNHGATDADSIQILNIVQLSLAPRLFEP